MFTICSLQSKISLKTAKKKVAFASVTASRGVELLSYGGVFFPVDASKVKYRITL
jgi:hypothetical protein